MFNSRKPRPPREQYQGSGQITAVEPQKTNANRVNIYIEGDYAFSLSELVSAENRLVAGKRLDLKQVLELQAEDLYRQGLESSLQALSRRPHSEAEIKTRLKRLYPEITGKVLDRVIIRLKELKYLDDAEFARVFVQNRTAYDPKGRLLIKRELSQKGVADTTIDEAVSRVLDDPEEQDEEGRGLEERNALELARRRARSFAGEDWPGFYRKLGNFLARRGFDYSIVKNTVRQVWRELKDETPEEEAE